MGLDIVWNQIHMIERFIWKKVNRNCYQEKINITFHFINIILLSIPNI